MKKKIVFLTGTRADFGKLKSLISAAQELDDYEVHIFATGMHLNNKYGKTIDEIYKCGFKNIYPFINHDRADLMDRVLSATINGFSRYVAEINPDLIIVHGDRVEALAGAIVGSLNNILVAHIEGGEKSGTIDELIRHAVSKMSHIHLVANHDAKKRLLQLGERGQSIFVIGSPDLDIMASNTLADLSSVTAYYGITFDSYGILLFHPVTTEIDCWEESTREVVDAIIESKKNYIVIYPNNDLGSEIIINGYKRFQNNPGIKIFPSLRFEYFLVLLHNADFIIGNSSAGIREAPYYNIPTINIGTRQHERGNAQTIWHCNYKKTEILDLITQTKKVIQLAANKSPISSFGCGNSTELFINLLNNGVFWGLRKQKSFQDRDF